MLDNSVPFKITHADYNAGWSKGFFTDAVTVEGPTKTIYMSGVGAEDPDAKTIEEAKILGEGDVAKQAKVVYEKISKILAENGATFANLVSVTTYVLNISHGYVANEVMGEFFSKADARLPTHTLLQIGAFSFPEMLVEVHATAVLPAS